MRSTLCAALMIMLLAPGNAKAAFQFYEGYAAFEMAVDAKRLKLHGDDFGSLADRVSTGGLPAHLPGIQGTLTINHNLQVIDGVIHSTGGYLLVSNKLRGVHGLGLSLGVTDFSSLAPRAGLVYLIVEFAEGPYPSLAFETQAGASSFIGMTFDTAPTAIRVYPYTDRRFGGPAFSMIDGVTAAVTPVPTALPLLAAALGGLGLLGSRRARASRPRVLDGSLG